MRAVFAAIALLGLIMAAPACGGNDGGQGGEALERADGTRPEPQQSDTGDGADAPRAEAAWMRMPVVPDFSARDRARLRVEVRRADRAGMRPRAFGKIGDSNTDYPQNLYGLGCREVDLGPHRRLAPTLRRYRNAAFPALRSYPGCEPPNSFSRDSAAAESGVWTEWIITPIRELAATGYIPPPPDCRRDESPLECELRMLGPRWSLILIGSNDVLLEMPLGATLEGHLRELVRDVRDHPSIPVLSTLPPMRPSTGDESERIAEANAIIAAVANDMNVPLINLWRSLTAPGMISDGLAADGLHLGYPDGEYRDVLAASADLDVQATRYGANKRHVVWLRTLARLDAVAGSQ